MRQSNGRAFLVDATGATEITGVSSEFLRALLDAGTAPHPDNDPASRPSLAILPASPHDGSRDGTAPDPTPAHRPRRTYFPRMTRMYNALFGARRRDRYALPGPPGGPFPSPALVSAPPRRAAAEPEPEATDEPVGLRRRRNPRRRRSLSDDAEEHPHRPRDSPRARDAVGALDFNRVARELAQSLAADANLAVPLRTDHVDGDGEGDAPDEDEAEAARRALRERVAFLADTLLAVLREVDARLTSGRVADADGFGFGFGFRPTTRAIGEGCVPATEAEVAALPVTVYSEADAKAAEEKGDTPQCYVCLGDFAPGEEIRELPCHRFHRACIDRWLLRSSRHCPTCRARVPAVDAKEEDEAANAAAVAERLARLREPVVPGLLFLPAPASA